MCRAFATAVLCPLMHHMFRFQPNHVHMIRFRAPPANCFHNTAAAHGIFNTQRERSGTRGTRGTRRTTPRFLQHRCWQTQKHRTSTPSIVRLDSIETESTANKYMAPPFWITGRKVRFVFCRRHQGCYGKSPSKHRHVYICARL